MDTGVVSVPSGVFFWWPKKKTMFFKIIILSESRSLFLDSADAKTKERSMKLHKTDLLLKETKEEKDYSGIPIYLTRKK